ncbi:MAG: formylglycine-generating enzyme family protein [Kiritimatiellae bacterium]|nr:formylglycine-generating enzyme family protein [Kiritimatiellia bacterium]
MIRLITACFALATSVMAFADGPTVSNVKAQQRYPWNALVDIDYTLSGDTSGLGVSISVRDVQNNKDYQPTKFMEALPTSAGTHRVTWNPAADGVSIISTNILVTVSLLRVADAPVTPNLYYVIDLAAGPDAVNYPVTTLSSEPAGGVWPDEYKTTKLVLRKIEPGTFMMGGSKSTTISQPFYIGVFEVTQKQYSLVMGSNPSYNKGDMRPVEEVSYDAIRGSSAGAGWPASSLVDGTSFLGKLRAKTGLNTFDLPTEAQWEYACRAGTTSTYNNGGNTEENLKTLGRYSGNQNDGRGGYSQHTTVGSYAPNAWGLYDMHGNVYEWCLDWDGILAGGTDPKGTTSGSDRVIRSGSWYDDASFCPSSYRSFEPPSNDSYGFRLCCSAGL